MTGSEGGKEGEKKGRWGREKIIDLGVVEK